MGFCPGPDPLRGPYHVLGRRASRLRQVHRGPDFKTMEDDFNTPLPQNPRFSVFFDVYRGVRPQKPFHTAQTSFFYPGKARQCRCSLIQVRFRPISGFWDFRFLCPGILVLGFLSFRGLGSGFKSNYEQNQPSGGSTFSKTNPPWISRARKIGISKKTCKSSTARLEV